jgi:hypothetical protein
VPETATVHQNPQGVRSGRGGISRAQRADGGRSRNHLPEPPGRSEWQGRHIVSTEEGRRWPNLPKVRLIPQCLRSGRGGIS